MDTTLYIISTDKGGVVKRGPHFLCLYAAAYVGGGGGGG
jgi:hypothetical protein